MSEGHFLGIAVPVLVGIGALVLVSWFFLGALGIHWAARNLKVKRSRFRTALLTNLMLTAVPSFAWGGTVLAQRVTHSYESMVTSVASLISFALCAIVTKAMYRVTFARAVALYLLSSAFGFLLLCLFVFIFVTLILVIGNFTGWKPLS